MTQWAPGTRAGCNPEALKRDIDASILERVIEKRFEIGDRERFVTPAIYSFSAKNANLSDEEIRECLTRHRIPLDRPLVTQISRFDRWKDPLGVIAGQRAAAPFRRGVAEIHTRGLRAHSS